MKNNIRKLRKEREMTQEELAKKAKVTRMTINNLECGRQTIIRTITMEKIAKALEKPIYEVFF